MEFFLRRVPYFLVIGAKEEEQKTVSVRHRELQDLGVFPLDRAITQIVEESNTQALHIFDFLQAL